MYYCNGRPHYYYANHKVTSNTKSAGVTFIVFAVIWILMSLPVVISSVSEVFVSGPLSLNYDTKIVIDDEIGIVDNKAYRRFHSLSGKNGRYLKRCYKKSRKRIYGQFIRNAGLQLLCFSLGR